MTPCASHRFPRPKGTGLISMCLWGGRRFLASHFPLPRPKGAGLINTGIPHHEAIHSEVSRILLPRPSGRGWDAGLKPRAKRTKSRWGLGRDSLSAISCVLRPASRPYDGRVNGCILQGFSFPDPPLHKRSASCVLRPASRRAPFPRPKGTGLYTCACGAGSIPKGGWVTRSMVEGTGMPDPPLPSLPFFVSFVFSVVNLSFPLSAFGFPRPAVLSFLLSPLSALSARLP
jgi:hypothetical protein